MAVWVYEVRQFFLCFVLSLLTFAGITGQATRVTLLVAFLRFDATEGCNTSTTTFVGTHHPLSLEMRDGGAF